MSATLRAKAQRLRDHAVTFGERQRMADAMDDAADEIERLRTRVEELKGLGCPESYVEKYGERAGGHFMDGVSFALRALTDQEGEDV